MKKKNMLWKVFVVCLMGGWAGLSLPGSSAEAALRINMKDGTQLEVEYIWEAKDEYRFEFSGGEAGIPKNLVESIHEILDSREFDPEVMLDRSPSNSPKEVLRDILDKGTPERFQVQKLTEEQSRAFLEETFARRQLPGQQVFHSPELKMSDRDYFTDLVLVRGREVMLLLRNLMVTRLPIGDYVLYLALFDGDGNLIQRKPCEVFELDADTLKELGVRGPLFGIRSFIEPDPKIRRYELVASRPGLSR